MPGTTAVNALPELTSMLDTLTGPAALLDLDYRIVAANRAYGDTFSPDAPIHGQHCYEVSHHYAVPCDQAGETCPLRKCLDSGQAQRVLHLHHTPQGEEHVDVEMQPIRNAQGEVVLFLEKLRTTRSASSRPDAHGLIGRSPAFNRMLEHLHRVAPSETTVLLLGESGTGKELVARAVHEGSRRAAGPFVAVECSGLSETLFESELFGHERGAFTGAHSRKPGLVEAARGGTLLLDEVGDIPLSQQVKLLRLLETGTFRRVGGVEVLQADFRLILATHRDLKVMVEDEQFRRDLYYRISAFPIRLPSLRERGEDITLLAQAMLKRLAPARNPALDPKTMSLLQGYAFPGNIRELRNILEHALLMADGDRILPEHLPEECRDDEHVPREVTDAGILSLDDVEKRYLREVVAQHGDTDKRDLARQLGVSERTLYRKLQALNS